MFARVISFPILYSLFPIPSIWIILGSCRLINVFRETQSVWERRAPLGPQHVRKLVKKGVKVLVQPSNRRAYPMAAYANVGAKIQEDISEASVIFGVKQVRDISKSHTFTLDRHSQT